MQIPDDGSSRLNEGPNPALEPPLEGDARQGLTHEEIHDYEAETLWARHREIKGVSLDEAEAWCAEAEVLSPKRHGCRVRVYTDDRELRVSLPEQVRDRTPSDSEDQRARWPAGRQHRAPIPARDRAGNDRNGLNAAACHEAQLAVGALDVRIGLAQG